MKTGTSTHLERITDTPERREDPYKGNEQARGLGLRARQYELAAKIWGTYLKLKLDEATESTGEQPADWKAEGDLSEVQPAGDPNPVRGTVGFSLLDIMLVVPKDKWAEVGIRAEDIVMLEKMANNNVPEEEAIAHAKQINFLTGVLGLLEELSNKQHTAETCNGIAAVFRGEVKKILTPEPVLSPEDFEGHPLG